MKIWIAYEVKNNKANTKSIIGFKDYEKAYNEIKKINEKKTDGRYTIARNPIEVKM